MPMFSLWCTGRLSRYSDNACYLDFREDETGAVGGGGKTILGGGGGCISE